MSSRTYDQKTARALQDIYLNEEGEKVSYNFLLNKVRAHMLTNIERMSSEVRAAMIYKELKG